MNKEVSKWMCLKQSTTLGTNNQMETKLCNIQERLSSQ